MELIFLYGGVGYSIKFNTFISEKKFHKMEWNGRLCLCVVLTFLCERAARPHFFQGLFCQAMNLFTKSILPVSYNLKHLILYKYERHKSVLKHEHVSIKSCDAFAIEIQWHTYAVKVAANLIFS